MTRYEGIDFVAIVERNAGVSLVRRSNHGKFGDEFWGACPFCRGGDNRFHVWPQGSRPHYWCRVCHREGSPAHFLMEYSNISFPEALEALGIPDDDSEHTYEPPTLNEQLARGAPPSKEWQQATSGLIERAAWYLWHPKSPEGQEALAYLRGRGLRDETIKRAKLGYVPLDKSTGRWYVGEFEKWGIDPDTLREDQRAKGGVRVPDGILIPWLEGPRVWKLCVKRPGQLMSYGQVMGSSDGGLYNIDSVTADQPAMMVESELCALSVQQEAGDICNCVATGSTPKGRNSRLASDLVAASCILQSFDADVGGDEASEYWTQRFKDKCTRWRPWRDEESGRFKDPNEMLQYADDFKRFTGTTLRGWVEQGIEVATLPPPEGPHPPETDETSTSSSPNVEPSEQPENGHFDDTVEQMADVLGEVQVTQHTSGLSLAEYVKTLRFPYAPVTLPSLPRKACPHRVYANGASTPCRGRALAHGWCAEHALSHELLELGAKYGYPEVELTFQTGYREGKPTTGARIIGESVMGWESYAEVAPEKWLLKDIARIKQQFRPVKLVS